MVDAVRERVLEALLLCGAATADLFCDFYPNTVAREEDRGRVIVAVAAGHPVRVHMY